MDLNINTNKKIVSIVFLALNHHIGMISERSCDTEDQSNGCRTFCFVITGINYILKQIKIKSSYFKL